MPDRPPITYFAHAASTAASASFASTSTRTTRDPTSSGSSRVAPPRSAIFQSLASTNEMPRDVVRAVERAQVSTLPRAEHRLRRLRKRPCAGSKKRRYAKRRLTASSNVLLRSSLIRTALPSRSVGKKPGEEPPRALFLLVSVWHFRKFRSNSTLFHLPLERSPHICPVNRWRDCLALLRSGTGSSNAISSSSQCPRRPCSGPRSRRLHSVELSQR
jgi:hypothetical protein